MKIDERYETPKLQMFYERFCTNRSEYNKKHISQEVMKNLCINLFYELMDMRFLSRYYANTLFYQECMDLLEILSRYMF